MREEYLEKRETENVSGGACDTELIEKIEKAYNIYKLSEVFLKDVERDYGKDYGKLKLARLRVDFARHELVALIEEAQSKGITLRNNELVQKFFYQEY